MQTFSDRLSSRRQEGESDRSFAKRMGVSDTMLRRYLEGTGTPRPAKLGEIAFNLGVHTNWLANGSPPRDIAANHALSPSRTEGEQMRRALEPAVDQSPAGEDAIALPRLTIVASAGQGIIPATEEIEDYLSVSRSYLREAGINPLAAHVLRISGHSMSPTLLDKDLVIIDTSQTTIRDEEIYALAYGETVLIKRLRPQWDGSIKIISDNKSGHYEDAHVPYNERNQLRIVGRVGGFLRYV